MKINDKQDIDLINRAEKRIKCIEQNFTFNRVFALFTFMDTCTDRRIRIGQICIK